MVGRVVVVVMALFGEEEYDHQIVRVMRMVVLAVAVMMEEG